MVGAFNARVALLADYISEEDINSLNEGKLCYAESFRMERSLQDKFDLTFLKVCQR